MKQLRYSEFGRIERAEAFVNGLEEGQFQSISSYARSIGSPHVESTWFVFYWEEVKVWPTRAPASEREPNLQPLQPVRRVLR